LVKSLKHDLHSSLLDFVFADFAREQNPKPSALR
jgi:hypothetical protein